MTMMTDVLRTVPDSEWVEVYVPIEPGPAPPGFPSTDVTWRLPRPPGVPPAAIKAIHPVVVDKRTESPTRAEPLGRLVCMTVHPDYVDAIPDRVTQVPFELRLMRSLLKEADGEKTYPVGPYASDAIRASMAEAIRQEVARKPLDDARRSMLARCLYQLICRGFPLTDVAAMAAEHGLELAESGGVIDGGED